MTTPTICLYCRSVIDLALGAIAPTGEDHDGTYMDPRAPGDYDDVCDQCNYGRGLPGGPHVDWALVGHVPR